MGATYVFILSQFAAYFVHSAQPRNLNLRGLEQI